MVCWHTIKRTTVKISDELDARLRHEAERSGRTISEITREALESYLGVASKRRFLFEKAGRSGYTDTSRRVEEILRAEAAQWRSS